MVTNRLKSWCGDSRIVPDLPEQDLSASLDVISSGNKGDIASWRYSKEPKTMSFISAQPAVQPIRRKREVFNRTCAVSYSR